MTRVGVQQRTTLPADVRHYYLAVGDAIRERRGQMRDATGQPVTQATLGKAIGRSGPFVSHVEAGQRKVYAHVLHQIAGALAVDPVTLLPGYSAYPIEEHTAE